MPFLWSLEGRNDYLIILAALEQALTLKQSKSSGFARAASSKLIDRGRELIKSALRNSRRRWFVTSVVIRAGSFRST